MNMNNLNGLWQKICDELSKEVTAVSFDLWIKSLEPVTVKDNTLYLSTTSETAKLRVLKLHSEQIKTAILNNSDEITDFKVLNPDEKEAFLATPASENNSDYEEKNNNTFNFNVKYTFDNFVVGNSNKYVYAAARGVAERPFDKINPLFIYGGVGLGKTHLLHAIGNFLKANNPNLNILYVTCEKFTNDYVDS